MKTGNWVISIEHAFGHSWVDASLAWVLTLNQPLDTMRQHTVKGGEGDGI